MMRSALGIHFCWAAFDGMGRHSSSSFIIVLLSTNLWMAGEPSPFVCLESHLHTWSTDTGSAPPPTESQDVCAFGNFNILPHYCRFWGDIFWLLVIWNQAIFSNFVCRSARKLHCANGLPPGTEEEDDLNIFNPFLNSDVCASFCWGLRKVKLKMRKSKIFCVFLSSYHDLPPNSSFIAHQAINFRFLCFCWMNFDHNPVN